MARCAQCGAELGFGTQCYRCGTQAQVPTSGATQAPWGAPTAAPGFGINTEVARSKRTSAGICGILLGALGVHKFVLGYTTEGLIMLLGSILTCGLGAVPFGIIGLIEGIIYLTKSDVEFDATYLRSKRGWF